MTTFAIEQFGCRATQADAAAIERQLRDQGFSAEANAATAGVVIVNTCTVTASADAQAREAIRTIHRKNPAAQIIVTGCYAQRAPEELAGLPGVRWVVGNSHKPEIPRLVSELKSREFPPHLDGDFVPRDVLDRDPLSLAHAPAKILTGNIFEQTTVLVAPVLGGEAGHTRPVLKIQDGCNSRCAYCVIPFVRGRSRSLPPDAVLEEIRKLVGAGFREVVLSGINLGTYGRDLVPRIDFIELLERILQETAMERLRVSSIEPMDVTEELIALFSSSERIAQHFHMPLQSGSDRILAAMHRWYRTEHYARRVELIHERLPDAAIGADVIAGFPGETEEDHMATLGFIRRLPFTYLHVFSYSKRPGTAAEKLETEVPAAVIKRRARELRALGEELSSANLKKQIGHKMRVLTLNTPVERAGEWTDALSSNYLRVRVRDSRPANVWLDVCATGVEENHLLAENVAADENYDSKMTWANA